MRLKKHNPSDWNTEMESKSFKIFWKIAPTCKTKRSNDSPLDK